MAFRNPVTTVSVAGTVTTSAAASSSESSSGASTSATVRGIYGWTGSTNYATAYAPKSTAVGDLLVAILAGSSRTAAASGWTTAWLGSSDTGPDVGVLTRIATAADVGGPGVGASYSFGNFGVSGSGANGSFAVVDISGATGVGSIVEAPLNSNGGGTTTTTQVPSCVAGNLALLTSSTRLAASPGSWSWSPSGTGGPPATQPALTGQITIATADGTYGNSSSYGVGLNVQSMIANWKTAAAYSAVLTAPSSSGNQQNSGLIIPIT